MGRRRKSAAAPLLLLIVLLSLLQGVLKGISQERLPNLSDDLPQQDSLDLALDELDRRGARTADRGGAVEIVAARRRVPAQTIIELLGEQASRSAFFTFDLAGNPEITASASGTDRLYRIVNAYLVGYAPFVAQDVWVPMQVLSRRKQYQYDHLQYLGRMEVWQSSEQAFDTPRGDCEDHALALADWLIESGYRARVALGTVRGEGHAWVVLFLDGQQFLLEATQKDWPGGRVHYPLTALMTDYRPRYQFDRDGFWRNNGSDRTTDYESGAWELKSRYHRGDA